MNVFPAHMKIHCFQTTADDSLQQLMYFFVVNQLSFRGATCRIMWSWFLLSVTNRLSIVRTSAEFQMISYHKNLLHFALVLFKDIDSECNALRNNSI